MQLTSAGCISPKNDTKLADKIGDTSVEQIMDVADVPPLVDVDNGDIKESNISKVADEVPGSHGKIDGQPNGIVLAGSRELSDSGQMDSSDAASNVEECTSSNALSSTDTLINNAVMSTSDDHMPTANGTTDPEIPTSAVEAAKDFEETVTSNKNGAKLVSDDIKSLLESGKDNTESTNKTLFEQHNTAPVQGNSGMSEKSGPSTKDDSCSQDLPFLEKPDPMYLDQLKSTADASSSQSHMEIDTKLDEQTNINDEMSLPIEPSESTSDAIPESLTESSLTDQGEEHSEPVEKPLPNNKEGDEPCSTSNHDVETVTGSLSGEEESNTPLVDQSGDVTDKADQTASTSSPSAQSTTDMSNTSVASNVNPSVEIIGDGQDVKNSPIREIDQVDTNPSPTTVSNKLQIGNGTNVSTGTTASKSEASIVSKQVILNTDRSKDSKSLFNIQPPTGESATTGKTDTPSAQDIKDGHAYLRPMPKFLYQLGLSLLREVVYEGLAEHVGGLREKGDKKYSEEQFQSLQKSLTNLRKDNQHLTLKSDKVCSVVIDGHRCKFRTESELALETHQSTTHMNRSNRYVCARCAFSTPHLTIFKNHMMDKHGLDAIVDKPLPFFPCKLCFFESSSSNRLQTHMNNCGRNFQLANNLKPNGLASTPVDETIFKPPAPKKTVTTVTLKNSLPGVTTRPTNTLNIMQSVAKGVPKHLACIRPAMTPSSRLPGSGTLQQIKINSKVVHTANAQLLRGTNTHQLVRTTTAQPSLHRPPTPVTKITTSVPASVNTDVVSCEICGGFIQGLHAMRVHMQWCHHINISHLKKPEFQCTTCLKRFWTVQGMAKHSSTCAEKLPSVNVADSKSNCFICCKPYFTSQVEHLLAKHLNDLKRMVEIKKCLAPKCSPFLFGSVENLQFHLAKEHRLKMTGLAGLASANVSNIKFQPFCSICKLKFSTSNDFAKHCAEKHVHKCDLCGSQCSTQQGLKEHETMVHPFRFCLACDKQIKRTHYKIHLFSMHNADKCRPCLKRISDAEYETYSKKPKLANWS